MSTELPPCGLYRTVAPIAGVDAGRLVYFHNHGDPGPGIYFPERWTGNRAHWSEKGVTLPAGFDPKVLRALPREGFYRVTKSFFCCEKKCTQFEPDQFVQLGYNGAGKPILFLPELGGTSISIPERGTVIDDAVLGNLVHLKMNEKQQQMDLSMPRGMIVH